MVKFIPSIVTVNVSMIIRLSAIPATPTFFAPSGAMEKRPTWTYFHGVWSMFIIKDSGILCFSTILDMR